MSDTKEVKKEKQPEGAVLFELEHLAMNSRKALYDILKSMLKDVKVDFTVPLFSRYCLLQPPEQVLAELPDKLGASKTDGKKFKEDALNALKYYYQSSDIEPETGLVEVLKAAGENNLAVMAVTLLDEDVARKALEQAGLTELGVSCYPYDKKSQTYPGADVWMKACKEIGVQPRQCLTLVTSMEACKSSLTAGMRSLVVPDEFTSFQDFGGANRVLEELTEAKPLEILEPLLPH